MRYTQAINTPTQLPYPQLVSIRFDIERYQDSVSKGIQPKVCGVLAWNQMTPKEAAFRPAFGNVIESRIHTDSIEDVLPFSEQDPGSY